MNALISVLTSFLTPVLFLVPPLFFAVLLAAGAAGLVPQRLRRPLSMAALLLCYGCAGLILLLHSRQTIVQFRLEGFRWPLTKANGEARLLAAGSGEEDEFRITDSVYKPKSFQFSLRSGQVWIDRGPGYDGRQAVRIGDRIVGLQPISSGAKIQLGDLTAEFRQGGLFGSKAEIVRNGAAEVFPGRRGKFPLLDTSFTYFVYPGPTSRLYPIAKDLKSRIAFGVPGGETEVNSAGILALDEEVTVDGRPVPSFPVQVPAGSGVQFLALKTCNDPAERRSNPCLRPVQGFAGLRLDPETSSLTAHLQRPRTVALRLEQAEERVAFSVRGSPEARLVQFGDLPRGFSTIVATFHLNSDGFRVESAQEEIEGDYGQTVALGRRDQLLVLPEANQDWSGPLRVLMATALVSVFLGWGLLGSWPHTALLGAVAVLSSMRLLFAWSASVLPPFSQESLELALYLLPVGPALILGADALVRVLMARTAQEEGLPGPGLANGCAALIFAAIAGTAQVRGLHLLAALALPLGLLLILGLSVFLPLTTLQRGRNGLEKGLNRWSFGSLAWVALGVYAVRWVLLFLFGFKEELPLGGAAFRLSVLYVPLSAALLGLGCALHLKTLAAPPGLGHAGAAAQRKASVLRFVLYCGWVIGLHLLTGFLCSDLGTFIQVLPAFLFLAALGWETFRRLPRQEGGLGLILLIAPALLVALFLLSPRGVLGLGELLAERDFALNNANAVIREQNQLRFLQYLNPGRVQEIGIRASEAIAQEAAIRESYLRQGFLGAGYLRVPIPPSFQATCLNDNVTAVYGMGQFGALGGIALTLACCLWLGAGLQGPVRSTTTGSDRFTRCLGLLSVLILAGTSLYMIGANVHLLPFTGRNLYLLGLNSFSDVAETGILAILAVFGIREEVE